MHKQLKLGMKSLCFMLELMLRRTNMTWRSLIFMGKSWLNTSHLKITMMDSTCFTTNSNASVKIQYTRLLDIFFPELADVTNTHNRCIYEMLKLYPTTAKISQAMRSSLSNIKYPKSSTAIAFFNLFSSHA